MKTSSRLLAAMVLLSSVACVKDKVLTPSDQSLPPNVNTQAPAKSTGMFVSSAHATSGAVKVLSDSLNQQLRYLVFENFKTDAGPDLRIYLAQDTRTTGFVELGRLEKTGNFNVQIPNSVNLGTHTHVLIWCKQFSVLFGYAALK